MMETQPAATDAAAHAEQNHYAHTTAILIIATLTTAMATAATLMTATATNTATSELV